jgi:MFS transporter, DHA1 family, 2-module integral membrane pump EmrD
MPEQTLKKAIFFCALLVFIGLTGSLSIDMYVPAMPAMAHALSASPTDIKLSLSLFLIPYALGQMFYGSLSDCIGRKKVLIPAVALGMLGSLLCAYMPHLMSFYAGRILQGAGFSAIGAIAPAMGRDAFDDIRFAQIGSILSMVFGIAPIFSPILGSYISHSYGWAVIFYVITVYALLVIMISALWLPETHDTKNRHTFHITAILKTYGRILKNHMFLKNTFAKSAAYTGFIAFYTVTPFMLQHHLHVSTIAYGWFTLALTGSILLAKLVNTLLLGFIDIHRLIFLSLCTLVLSTLLLLTFALFGLYSVSAVVIPFMLFGVASGFLFSNTTVASFHSFKKTAAGSVSGLHSGIQLFCAFAGSLIAAHLSTATLMPLAIFMGLISASGLMQYLYHHKR